MNATTPLRKALGRVPFRYTVEPPLNDYQLVVTGPVGRAVITEINSGEDYEIETTFDGQGPRLYNGFETPGEAFDQVMHLTNNRLVNLGVEIPPSIDPRRVVAGVLAVALVIFLVSFAVAMLLAHGDDDGHQPTAPITYSPAQTLEGPR